MTALPLDGMVVKGPAVVAASPRVRIEEWVKPGVVTTTAEPLVVVKPE